MSNNQSFQNENISVTLTREPYCRVHLAVTVSPKAVEASRHKAVKNINKEVSVPGFRKGKAPEAMVLKNFSTHVEKEWKDILLNTTFDEAIHLAKVFPFNKNSVTGASVKTLSLTEGATLSYDYESAPEVPTINSNEIALTPVKRQEVKEKDIEHALEDLRLQSAEWVDVTDRPVQEGDFVDADIDAIGDSPRNICTNSRLGVMEGKMGDWMRKLVIGLTPGQSAEAMSEEEAEDCQACEQGEEHGHTHGKFIPTLCRISVHGIKEAKLPVLDDELAKKYGASGLEDLKQKIGVNLNKRADEALQNAMRAQLEHALLSKYIFDLPHSMVQGQVKSHKKDIIDDLRSRGTEEAAIPAEARKIENDLANKIDRDFRLYFLIQKAAKDNHINVPEEEVNMEWMRQMWYQQMGQNSIDTSGDPEEVKGRIYLQLLTVKTIDALLSKATVAI